MKKKISNKDYENKIKLVSFRKSIKTSYSKIVDRLGEPSCCRITNEIGCEWLLEVGFVILYVHSYNTLISPLTDKEAIIDFSLCVNTCLLYTSPSPRDRS